MRPAALSSAETSRAAIHFVLVTAGIPKAAPASSTRADVTVRAGVDAFLDGYGAR